MKLLKGGVHGDILLKINLFIYPNKYLYFFYDKKSFPGFKGDNKGLNRYTGNTWAIQNDIFSIRFPYYLVQYCEVLGTCDLNLDLLCTWVHSLVPCPLRPRFSVNLFYVPPWISPLYQFPKVLGGMQTVTWGLWTELMSKAHHSYLSFCTYSYLLTVPCILSWFYTHSFGYSSGSALSTCPLDMIIPKGSVVTDSCH